MFILKKSNFALQAKGLSVMNYDKFQIAVCSLCGCQYLHNVELAMIYYDPSDLKQWFDKFYGQPMAKPCRQCKAENWEISELEESDKEKVKSGPWAWVLDSPY